MNISSLKLICIAAGMMVLSACSPVGMATGASASLGLASSQEGGLRGAITDAAIQLQITDNWLKHDLDMYRRLSFTVKEGRVLVTGSVPNPDMRVEAVRLVWRADGVKQVLNEISVDNNKGILTSAKDVWIASNIRTRLMFDKYVESINYTVDTSNGNVYLMGIAQDQKELNRVIEHARNTKNVSNVVNYVRLRYQDPNALNY